MFDKTYKMSNFEKSTSESCNVSMNSSLVNRDKDETIVWIAAFGGTSVAIVIANILAIFAFTQGHFRRKRTYILLVNLAISDMVIGVIAIPFYISIAFFALSENTFVYLCFDVSAGLASVFTIGLVSVERLSAVALPLKHLLLRPKHYVMAIALIWLFAVMETLLLRIVLPHYHVKNAIRAHITIVSISVPFFVTVTSYIALCMFKHKSFARFRGQKNDDRDSHLARTLLIVTTVFFLTWSPFAVSNVIDIYSCTQEMCSKQPEHFFRFTKLIQYSNSLINPAIYSMRIPAFRESLKNVCCKVPHRRDFEMLTKSVQLNRNQHRKLLEMNEFGSPRPLMKSTQNDQSPLFVHNGLLR